MLLDHLAAQVGHLLRQSHQADQRRISMRKLEQFSRAEGEVLKYVSLAPSACLLTYRHPQGRRRGSVSVTLHRCSTSCVSENPQEVHKVDRLTFIAEEIRQPAGPTVQLLSKRFAAPLGPVERGPGRGSRAFQRRLQEPSGASQRPS